MSALTFVLGRAGRPKSHAVQETVTNDKGVEQHRAEVGEKRQEQEIRENRMRFAQYGIESRDVPGRGFSWKRGRFSGALFRGN